MKNDYRPTDMHAPRGEGLSSPAGALPQARELGCAADAQLLHRAASVLLDRLFADAEGAASKASTPRYPAILAARAVDSVGSCDKASRACSFEPRPDYDVGLFLKLAAVGEISTTHHDASGS